MNRDAGRHVPHGLAPLAIRNYALYFVGFGVSNAGRWVELTGSLWLIYELTHSPLLLGMVGLARAAPAIILSPIGGVIADRVDQRRMLYVTQGLSLVTSMALGTLVALDVVEAWHVYAQLCVQAAVQAFDAAARQALFPRLVPRSVLPEAVTLTVTAGRSAKLVGPILGGIALAGFGLAAPYAVNAASFLVLIAAVAWMRGVEAPTGVYAGFRTELLAGFGEIGRLPVIRGLFNLEIAFSLFQMNEVMITIIARELLRVGPVEMGILVGGPAVGSMAGIAFLIVRAAPQRQGRFAIICSLAYAGMLLILALARDFVVCLALLALIGCLDSLITVTRHSMMQLAAPSAYRGRVMANMATVANGLGPLAQTQSGVLTGIVGASPAIAIAGAILGFASAAAARRNSPLWHYARHS